VDQLAFRSDCEAEEEGVRGNESLQSDKSSSFNSETLLEDKPKTTSLFGTNSSLERLIYYDCCKEESHSAVVGYEKATL
jgi:hypothetical protein